MTYRFRWLSFTSALAVLATGCPDDVVDNPFNATEGASSSTGADDGQDVNPDDDGQDDGVDSTAAESGGSGDSGSGTTMNVVDDSSGSDGTTVGMDSGSSSDTGEPPPPDYDPCPEGVLPNAPLPNTVNGSSSGEDSEFGSTCGGGGAPDVAWLFTAPFDGDFTFDTQGSSIDTVLHVPDGNCMGAELQCNDDGIVNTTQSMLSIPMVQDQEVTVVVDAFGLTGGNVSLTVREGSVSCPTDIGSTVPQVVSDQTQVALDEFAGSCGTGAAADRAFLFTPPQDAT